MTRPERNPGQVRPYVVTGGRTRPAARVDLPVEALVTTTPLGSATLCGLVMEWRPVAQLCQDPLSVAEVSAHLELPLGVARVLVADMAEAGLVTVDRGPPSGGAGVDAALLERVLQGLRTL